MATAFDPYAEWLGIKKRRQAPNYYELLGLPRYCDDPAAIQTAADQRLLQIGARLQGPQAPWARRLLEELTEARTTLLSPDSKAEYDARLRQGPPGRGGWFSGRSKASPTEPAAARPIFSDEPIVAGSMDTATPVASAESVVRRRDSSPPILLLLVIALSCFVLALLATVGALIYKKNQIASATAPPSPSGVEAVETPETLGTGDGGTGAIQASPDILIEPDENPGLVVPDSLGRLHLLSTSAGLHNGTFLRGSESGMNYIAGWRQLDQYISWEVEIPRPGTFRVEVTYAALDSSDNGRYVVQLGETQLGGTVVPTGGRSLFITKTIGLFKVGKAGRYTVTLRAVSMPGRELMSVEAVRLVPSKAEIGFSPFPMKAAS